MEQIRTPYLLDMTTYLTVAAMSLLGISGLSSLRLQVIALGLCLLFGLFHFFVFQSGRYKARPALYFGSQAVLMVLLFLLGSRNTDAFNFLFIILAINAAAVLPIRSALIWIAIYAGIIVTHTLAFRGLEGLYAVLFYLVTYIAAGVFGRTIQQVELARQRNQELVEELQAAQSRLKILAAVEERNRMARELHDSVKQQVFAILMQLGAARASLAESDPAHAAVMAAESLAKQAGAELNHLIHQLRPPGLEGKTLEAALRDYITGWSQQSGIAADVQVSGSPSVNPSVEAVLFRVTQEGLANVSRHSRASQVQLMLCNENDEVRLVIGDNGIGFDEVEAVKGVGLDSMRERLAAVGGSLEVARRQPSGTQVIARVRRS